MHLHVIMAYAMLIWWSRDQPFAPIVTSTAGTWCAVFGGPVIVLVAARVASVRACASLERNPNGASNVARIHHRTQFILRMLTLLTFAAVLTLTRWCPMLKASESVGRVPGLADMIAISPFLLSSVLALWAVFPIDHLLRRCDADATPRANQASHPVWGLREYLGFNIRHQLLAVVVPMTAILFVYDLTRTYRDAIESSVRIPWAPDIAMGLTAAIVFVFSPWILRYIWTTRPLQPGKLRGELESFCKRIGLKCRDILIWDSGGMIVNAAVMGMFRPMRFVVLSDGLLDSMTDKQVEAVFGHEAGHVRHAHIPFFLLFALASMLIASGVMECLFRFSLMQGSPLRVNDITIQGVGLLTMVVIWGLGFGFVSQRFERQADLFGARCVSAKTDELCVTPCTVHGNPIPNTGQPSGVCATGVDIFASALDTVARINGVPRTEWSWRHSSIANRVTFLKSVAGDPGQLRRFERSIFWIKTILIATCVVGLGIGAYYVGPYVWKVMSARR